MIYKYIYHIFIYNKYIIYKYIKNFEFEFIINT